MGQLEDMNERITELEQRISRLCLRFGHDFEELSQWTDKKVLDSEWKIRRAEKECRTCGEVA
jgi:hypothetical protein